MRECTFLLFSLASLVAFVDTLDGAHGQDDGDDEEEDSADDAGSDRLLFEPFGEGEGARLARRLARQRVRIHPEHVFLAHFQFFHCIQSYIIIQISLVFLSSLGSLLSLFTNFFFTHFKH